jgi:UDP-N-acetylmuramoyl-L-alanyl-D-glutamate--2,6-diaminopimelate ligase
LRLSELLRDLAFAAPRLVAPAARDPEIRGVAHDSRRVEPGDLYVALAGQRFDGWSFAAEAVGKGAVAVAGAPRGMPADLPVPVVALEAPRATLGPLAARVYGHPERGLTLAAVTGTNGKTTVATLAAAMLTEAGRPAGFVGTLGYRFGARDLGGGYTTPEASDLFRTLRDMRQEGARAVAMEVSSHALDMGRVNGVSFDVAVFTNLTRDHLDYHRDMDDYFAAKRRLFERLKPGGRAAVNVEDPYGRRLASELPRAVTFGAGGDVYARATELGSGGIHAVLATPRGDLRVDSPLIGRYNLANLLAAAAAGEALALPHEAVAAAFAAQQPLPGRMEPVDRGQPFAVFVDYAHTDAALAAALRAVREVAAGRRGGGKPPGSLEPGAGKVAVVFGCGGERDPGKRPLMGRVAGELADLPIVTSDNPRGEDPLAIIAAVEAGVRASGNRRYRLVPDRREAIRQAIGAAEPGWAVLVAGKGHEPYQVVGGKRLPFSDVEEVGRALEERFGQA